MRSKDQFPVYGHTADYYQEAVEVEQPPGWVVSTGEWKEWYDQTCSALSEIWPRPSDNWTEQRYWQVTQADLSLMRRFQASPHWKAKTGKLYLLEDANQDWVVENSSNQPDNQSPNAHVKVVDSRYGTTFAIEHPQSPLGLAGEPAKQTLLNVFAKGYLRASMNLHAIKRDFQRPRPALAQFLLDPTLRLRRLELTATGHTPSFIAGHTAETLVCAIHVLLDIPGKFTDQTEDGIDALLQWANEVGERRIWAGLHYPLDSLGGWVFVTRLLPHVYERDQARRALYLLVRAIDRSRLYNDIKNDVALSPVLRTLSDARAYAAEIVA